MVQDEFQLTFIPVKVARNLAIGALFLILASTVGQFFKYELGYDNVKGFVPLFYLDYEWNIPTFYSVFLLLVASSLFFVLARLEKERLNKHVSKWVLLSLLFLFMGVDEFCCFHERLNAPISNMIGNETMGNFYFAWVIPGIVVAGTVGVYFFRFVWQLPNKTKLLLVFSAFLYLGGALGFELIGGRQAEMHGMNNWLYTFYATVEETLEMSGVILLIFTLMSYIQQTYHQFRLSFFYN